MDKKYLLFISYSFHEYFCRKNIIKNPNKNTPLIQKSPSIPNIDSILRINASAPFLK
jgi:hypothetical protein